MGNFLAKGVTFVDGVSTANAANLNNLVDNAVLKPEAITSLALKDPLAGTEQMMISDAGTLKKVTTQELRDFALVGAIPVGGVIDYAGGTAPTGWFLCQGQAISRATYSVLFGIIGVTYGAGDGVSTFSLPDCRGRVVAAEDAGAGRIGGGFAFGMNTGARGGVGGYYVHQLTVAEMPSHAHTFNDYYEHAQGPHGGPLQFGNDFTPQGATTPNGTANAGSFQYHNNVQPTIIMQTIIKYQ
jgi:microcystin-dependent protein